MIHPHRFTYATSLLCLLTMRLALFADSPEIVLNEPQKPDSGCTSLTLKAVPGDYLIQTCDNLLNSWIDETNVTVVNGYSTDLTLPLDGRNTLFIRAKEFWPTNEVIFGTVGSTFEPEVFCADDALSGILWTWSDGSTSSDYPVAFHEFGSVGPRHQRLICSPASPLTAVNLGFDGADGGGAVPLNARPPQNVGEVTFPRPLTRLRYWASSYNPITNTLDFSGFASLESMELYHCTNLQHVLASNLRSLKRIVVEDCDLQELDLSGNPALEDLRCSQNAFTNILLDGGTGPQIVHWCTRDNPQLTQQFQTVMTNFHSLRDFWSWNNSQFGELSFVSTNLSSVWAHDNRYTLLDLHGHPDLWSVRMFDNDLTNISIGDVPALSEFDAHDNHLTTEVLDGLLAFFDGSTPLLTYLNLSQNAQPPSPQGLVHYSNLVSRGTAVFVDWPESSDGQLDVPGGQEAMTFVTSTRNPHLEIRVKSGAPVTIVWHWGDGVINRGTLRADHDFGTEGIHTNYVEVSPPGMVTYFGSPRTSPAQGITAVYGASNFTALDFLHLYREDLTALSLAGCANLRQLHLAGTPVTSEVCDQWFTDLDGAVTGPVADADFWYPANTRTAASEAAWENLVQKGFKMHPF